MVVVLVARGRSRSIRLMSVKACSSYTMTMSGIGLARGGAMMLDPLTSSITNLPNERFSPAVPMTDSLPLLLGLVVDLACWDYLVRCTWLCNKSMPGHE